MPLPPHGAVPSAAPRPTFELVDEESEPPTEAPSSPWRGQPRQDSGTWAILEAITDATDSDASNPEFFAKLSEGIRTADARSDCTVVPVVVPATSEGASALLADLTELALDEEIAGYDALNAFERGEGRHA